MSAATATRPATPAPGQLPQERQPATRYIQTGARRTLIGLVGSALAVLPLLQILTDGAWVLDAWTAMAVAILPAAALRLRQPPRAVHLLPGVLLVILLLTMRYVPDNAVGGVLPLHGAWSDIAALSNQVGDTIRNGTAPLVSTPAIRMVLSAQLVLLAVAIDLIAVVARRPALAGIPFLLVFTLAGAVPRHGVGWLWFALAAVGYLLLLSSDSRDELARWGRMMPRTHTGAAAAGQASAGRRIALIAIVVAVAAPFVIPIRSGDLIADVLHNGVGDGIGNGKGNGGVGLSAFASLKGRLTRSSPITLFTVDGASTSGSQPFYLRQEVLDFYDGRGWTSHGSGSTEGLDATEYAGTPFGATSVRDSTSYQVTIRIDRLVGNAPVFGMPSAMSGLPAEYGWSPQTDLVVGSGIHGGTTYTEQVRQPDPTVPELQSANPVADPGVSAWLQLPPNIPSQVSKQLSQLIEGKTTSYDKARAISDYFTNPVNGFVYSLQTKDGDSGSDLVDFLTNKTGYCQQFAAAMGVMLRMAGIPARIVLGYTHPVPDSKGHFVVTTDDAHAWVEAYFGSIGWVPFDPTPLATGPGTRAVALPWAPHAPGSGAGGEVDPQKHTGSVTGTGALDTSSGQPLSTSASRHGGGLPGWLTSLLVAVGGGLLVLLLVPANVRWTRRRARIRAAAHGPDPLWAELADTAVDLGYVWSPVRTPRQVVRWLGREGLSPEAAGSLQTLARAVEQSRYAPPSQPIRRDDLVGDLREISGALRATRTRADRVRARLLPSSLPWLGRLWFARRH